MRGIIQANQDSESVTGADEVGNEDVSDLYDQMVGGFGMLPGTARSFSSGWNTGRKHPHHFSLTSPAAPIEGSSATAYQDRNQVDNAVLNLDLGTIVPFDLCGELFHVFISYRVNTEGADGNSFASKLYHQLQMQSNGDDEFNIPAAGVGKYPRFARELPPGIANKPNVAKVYLDTECLQDGQEWMVGFVRGLAVSIVTVLLVSLLRPVKSKALYNDAGTKKLWTHLLIVLITVNLICRWTWGMPRMDISSGCPTRLDHVFTSDRLLSGPPTHRSHGPRTGTGA
jgi:hypothetical protein